MGAEESDGLRAAIQRKALLDVNQERTVRTIIISYGCGYGIHEDTIEVDDDTAEEEIEKAAQQIAFEHFDWSWREE